MARASPSSDRSRRPGSCREPRAAAPRAARTGRQWRFGCDTSRRFHYRPISWQMGRSRSRSFRGRHERSLLVDGAGQRAHGRGVHRAARPRRARRPAAVAPDASCSSPGRSVSQIALARVGHRSRRDRQLWALLGVQVDDDHRHHLRDRLGADARDRVRVRGRRASSRRSARGCGDPALVWTVVGHGARPARDRGRLGPLVRERARRARARGAVGARRRVHPAPARHQDRRAGTERGRAPRERCRAPRERSERAPAVLRQPAADVGLRRARRSRSSR